MWSRSFQQKTYSKEKQLTNQLTNHQPTFLESPNYICFSNLFRHMKKKLTTKPIGRQSSGKLAASRIALEKLVLPTCADLNFQTNDRKIFHALKLVHPLFFLCWVGERKQKLIYSKFDQIFPKAIQLGLYIFLQIFVKMVIFFICRNPQKFQALRS